MCLAHSIGESCKLFHVTKPSVTCASLGTPSDSTQGNPAAWAAMVTMPNPSPLLLRTLENVLC